MVVIRDQRRVLGAMVRPTFLVYFFVVKTIDFIFGLVLPEKKKQI